MKINYPILRKALGFAFLPTLLVVVVAMFATLSFSVVFDFLLSNSGWAIAIRIVLFIVEVGLVCGLYEHYLDQEKIKKAIGDSIQEESNWEKVSGSKSVGYIGNFSDSYKDTYYTKKINQNLYLVKRTQS